MLQGGCRVYCPHLLHGLLRPMNHEKELFDDDNKPSTSHRQRSQCPGTADGERCTHDAFLQHHQLRCAYCADGITADKMGPEGFHRKYEAAALEVCTACYFSVCPAHNLSAHPTEALPAFRLPERFLSAFRLSRRD